MVVEVHPRIIERHPELTVEDVQAAVKNAERFQRRLDIRLNEVIGIGLDCKSRLLQWVAHNEEGSDTWFVFHAMPATKKMLRELGVPR
jgi:hypothetical protein